MPDGSDPAYDLKRQMSALNDDYPDYLDQDVFSDTPIVAYDNPHPKSLANSDIISTASYAPSHSDTTQASVYHVTPPSVDSLSQVSLDTIDSLGAHLTKPPQSQSVYICEPSVSIAGCETSFF